VILKPLASKHHAEIQRITDRAVKRFPDLTAIEVAIAAEPTRDGLAEVAFAWAHQVLTLGGWGWWSVSADGRLNPALVSWNKAWWLVPIDAVLERPATLGALLDQVRALPPGQPGTLERIV
jgi:hypothetical protein